MQKLAQIASKPPLSILLAQADCSQASFARLTGITARQINAWCRSQAATPRWALILAATLQQHSPEALTMALEEALLSCVTAEGALTQTTGEELCGPVSVLGAG